MYSHILVPLDGSALAEVALPHATNLAQGEGCTVTLLRVIPPISSYIIPEAAFVDWDQIERSIETEAAGYLQTVHSRMEASPCRVNTLLKHGDPATVVSETAHAMEADLIVMATHGRTGIGRWTLGSVADRVVRTAGLPVMLIRPPKMPAEPEQ